MCNINAFQAAGLGLSAAGVIGNTVSSVQEARAYSKYSQAQTNSTLENYRYQTRALKNRYSEEVEAINQNRQSVYLENLQQRATAITRAASSGVEGNSLDSLFLGYERATAVNNYLTDRELRLKGLQLNDDADALRVNALNSVNSQSQYTNKTASTLLSGMGGLLSQYSESYLKSNYFRSGR